MLHTSIVQSGDVGLVIKVFKLGEMMKDEKHLQSIKTVQVTVYFFSNSVRFCNLIFIPSRASDKFLVKLLEASK